MRAASLVENVIIHSANASAAFTHSLIVIGQTNASLLLICAKCE